MVVRGKSWRRWIDWLLPGNGRAVEARSRIERNRPLALSASSSREIAISDVDDRLQAGLVDLEECFFPSEEEVSEAELQEFLACDLDPTEADPRFRENLREQIWTLIEEGELLRRRDH